MGTKNEEVWHWRQQCESAQAEQLPLRDLVFIVYFFYLDISFSKIVDPAYQIP
jgi:hypothetical protein